MASFFSRKDFSENKFLEYLLFNQQHQDMEDLDMDLLDPVGVLAALYPDLSINHRGEQSARFPRQTNDLHAFSHGCLSSFYNIHGVAAGTDGQKYIALLPHPFHIPGKDLIETVVIGGAGNMRRIGNAYGRKGRPFPRKTPESSSAKCMASVMEPPFPQDMTFPPF